MTNTIFVVTHSQAVQIGEYEWKQHHHSHVFSMNTTMKEIMNWLKMLGVENPTVNDITLSQYHGETVS
jgi:hypothetical protein